MVPGYGRQGWRMTGEVWERKCGWGLAGSVSTHEQQHLKGRTCACQKEGHSGTIIANESTKHAVILKTFIVRVRALEFILSVWVCVFAYVVYVLYVHVYVVRILRFPLYLSLFAGKFCYLYLHVLVYIRIPVFSRCKFMFMSVDRNQECGAKRENSATLMVHRDFTVKKKKVPLYVSF